MFFKTRKMALSTWKSTTNEANREILILLTYQPFGHLIKRNSGWNPQAQTISLPVCYCMHLITIPYFAQLCRTMYHQFLTYLCRAAKVQRKTVLVLELFEDTHKLTLICNFLSFCCCYCWFCFILFGVGRMCVEGVHNTGFTNSSTRQLVWTLSVSCIGRRNWHHWTPLSFSLIITCLVFHI